MRVRAGDDGLRRRRCRGHAVRDRRWHGGREGSVGCEALEVRVLERLLGGETLAGVKLEEALEEFKS
jgi:hypothetical protein